jgi:CBS domain-containing protein
MVDRGIRHLPVLDEQRRVVGVLAVDDLRAALPVPVNAREPLPPADRDVAREWRVGDIMTHAPETIGEDASLAEAAERMADAHIGCLPVVDASGRLAAILTETDLLHALATALWSERLRGRRGADPLVDLVISLQRERDRLRERMLEDRRTEDALGRDLQEVPLDIAERGADESEIQRIEALDALTHRRIEAIERALERAEAGRLDVCERCGGKIAVTRLRALPGTGLCVACARSGEET